jgi:hypothetical protein
MFGQIRDGLTRLIRPGDGLVPDFDLGDQPYIFQSDHGVDYSYIPLSKGDVSVTFLTPAGTTIALLVLAEPPVGERYRLFWVIVDGELLSGMDFRRAQDVPAPLRDVISRAVMDLNAEHEARRQRRAEVIERAGATAPSVTEEPTPLDRLRSDFDLGPEDFDFVSARGWEYQYYAGDDETPAAICFTAPSNAVVFLALQPQTGGSRREIRIWARIDDVEVSETPLLTVTQFPGPIQWLIRSAIADLNEASKSRARTGEER